MRTHEDDPALREEATRPIMGHPAESRNDSASPVQGPGWARAAMRAYVIRILGIETTDAGKVTMVDEIEMLNAELRDWIYLNLDGDGRAAWYESSDTDTRGIVKVHHPDGQVCRVETWTVYGYEDYNYLTHDGTLHRR